MESKTALICYFANGRLASPSVTIEPQPMQPSFVKAHSIRKSGRRKYFSMAAKNGVEFRGATAPPTTDGTDHVLMLRHKETGETMFLPAEMVEFHPTFPAQDEARVKTEEEESKKSDDLSYADKKEQLTMEFGGKRIKNYITNRKRNMVAEDTLSKVLGAASDAVGQSPVGPSPDSSPSQLSSALPHFNPTATSPEDVYSIEAFLTPSELLSLEPVVDNFLKKSPRKLAEEGHSRFVLEMFASFQSLAPGMRPSLASYLIYLSAIVHIKLEFGNNIKVRIDTLPEEKVPSCLRARIVQEFLSTQGGGGKRTGGGILKLLVTGKKKLLCYMSVLTLLMNGLKLDVARFCVEWQEPQNKLSDLVRVLGCKTSRGSTVAVLDGPPAPPKKGAYKRVRR